MSDLHKAVLERNLKYLHWLNSFKAFSYIHIQDENGDTPLHLALKLCMQNPKYVKVVMVLLGFDHVEKILNTPNYAGQTPVTLAQQLGIGDISNRIRQLICANNYTPAMDLE